MLPKLLGKFGATSRREIALRRAMLALRVSPSALARLGPLLPAPHRQRVWFEFVARLAFWRGVRRTVSRARWVRLTRGVPVLLYHAFGGPAGWDRYILPMRSFSRQMRALAALRYRVIPFEAFAEALGDCRLPPPRAVVITIDDGYADNAELALPVLRRRRFPATIFLVSSRIGKDNDWTRDGPLRGRPLLSLEQIARMRNGSVRFGAHTRSHCSLPKVADDQVGEEIEGSRADLELRLGTGIETFAYPYGRYDPRAVAAVKESGFIGAGTTEPRLARPDDDPALIPRIEISGSDSLIRFLVKLWFGAA
jgi:peptidoglycan/xylan/chitin deacetylase (PgdA/CDA1 family)